MNVTSKPATELGVGGNSDQKVDEVGPLSILPICVSLFAVVAIAIAACVFYRKRQRQREQLLARQLRVTERRIDAVGSLREKREKEVVRKPLYIPPTDVRASASEPSIVSRPIPGIRPHYVIRAYQPRPPIRAKLQSSVVNSSACSCDYGESTFCSTCVVKERDEAAKRDASAGSLAVELATVPSVSSLTTLHTPSGRPAMRRTRSETAGTPQETTRPLHSLRIGSITSTPGRNETTPSKHILAWMEKSTQPTSTAAPTHPLPPTALNSHLAPSSPRPEVYMSLTVTTASEQEPPPNTPVSQSIVTSVDGGAAEKALSYMSEDALSEKWV